MGMSIGELFIELGFDVDDKKLTEFNDKIKSGAGEMLKMSAIATGAVYALNAFMESSAQKAVAMQQFTLETGYASDALQKWQNLIHITNPNVGVEEAANNYKKLAQTLIDIRQGKGNSGALAMLGVTYDADLTPEKALEQISQHLQETIAQNGVGFTTDKLNSIGIGAGSLNALMLSPEQRDKMAAPFNISAQDQEKLRQYAEQIAVIELEWSKFKAGLTADWSGPLIEGIGHASEGLHEFLINLKALIQFLSDYKDQIKFVAAAFAPLLTLMAVAEFPMTAAIIAITFAINEMGKAIRGLPTVTGTFLDDAVHGNFEWARKFADAVSPIKTPEQIRAEQNREFLMYHGQKVDGAKMSIQNNNTFHIQTKGNAKETADETVHLLQQQNNSAYQQLNLGPQY